MNCEDKLQGVGQMGTTPQGQGVAFKAQFNDELRRFIVPPSFGAVQARVRAAFNLNKETDALVLKYKDEEGDLITFTSDEELGEALRLHGAASTPLRIFVQLKTDTQQTPGEASGTKDESTRRLHHQHRGQCHGRWFQDRWAYMTKEEREAFCEQRRAICAQKRSEFAAMTSCSNAEGNTVPATAEVSKQPGPDDLREGWRRGGFGGRCMRRHERWAAMSEEEREAWRQRKHEFWASHHHHHHPQSGGEAAGEGRKHGGGWRRKARFVKHVTFPDYSVVAPGTSFIKIWKFRNESEHEWPQGCSLVFISKREGDSLGAPESVPLPVAVKPGEEVDIAVVMRAPEQEGRYVSFWRLAGPLGRKFGPRVWVKIDIAHAGSVPPKTAVEEDNQKETLSSSDELQDMEKEVEQLLQQRDPEPATAPEATATESDTIASKLRKLKEMGFTLDMGRTIALLQEYDDLNRVVEILMS